MYVYTFIAGKCDINYIVKLQLHSCRLLKLEVYMYKLVPVLPDRCKYELRIKLSFHIDL